jgi:RHS repeat-associated protein
LKNNYLYQGANSELDDDIGWHDFMLRNYDAQIGRWVQQDPFQQFASPYSGMANDPVNFTDPSGGSILSGLSTAGRLGVTTLGGAILGTAVYLIAGGDDYMGTLIGAGAGLAVGLGGLGALNKQIAISMSLHTVAAALNILKSNITTNQAGKQAASVHGQDKLSVDNGSQVNQQVPPISLIGVYDGLGPLHNLIGTITVAKFIPYNVPSIGGSKYGVIIQLKYKSLTAKYNDFRWIQTIETNSPPIGAGNIYNDPFPSDDPEGQWKPFYYNDKENSKSNENGAPGFNAKFHDEPARYSKPDRTVNWEGELSLVGKNNNGVYVHLVTLRYGFSLSPKSVLTLKPITVATPSFFQTNSIKAANSSPFSLKPPF